MATFTAFYDANVLYPAEFTLAGDKGYDTREFVAELRQMQVTPPVACNEKRPGGSALDARTTRHPAYGISQQRRKRVEQVFGWLKTIAGQRKTRYRGLWRVGWIFIFAAAAYNLVRIRTLLTARAPRRSRRLGARGQDLFSAPLTFRDLPAHPKLDLVGSSLAYFSVLLMSVGVPGCRRA